MADEADGASDEPDETERREQDRLDQRIGTLQDTARFSIPFAVVPFVFVYMLLSAVLPQGWSDQLVVLFPLAIVGAMLLVPLGLRANSRLPLRVPGHAPLRGRAKRRALAMAALLTMLSCALAIWGPLFEARFLGWLRETLMAWRI